MMSSTLQPMLGLAALINFGILLLWFVTYVTATDCLYRLHNRWFQISREQFAMMHYAGMAIFKLMILVFNLGPYLALLLLQE